MPKAERSHKKTQINLKLAAKNCIQITGFFDKRKVRDTDIVEAQTEDDKTKTVLQSDTTNKNITGTTTNEIIEVEPQLDPEKRDLSNTETVNSESHYLLPLKCIKERNEHQAARDCDFDATSSKDVYKGFVLERESIIKRFEWMKVNKPNKKGRTYAFCKTCNTFYSEAVKFSKNGQLPIAFSPGVQIRFLKRFVDHSFSNSHLICVEKETLKETWDTLDTQNHPWLKLFKKQDQTTRETLVNLAVTAYNDMKVGTLSAWSWPARHLATLHAESQLLRIQEVSSNAFIQFHPTPQQLHYVSPNIYSEMCEVIGYMQIENLKSLLEASTCIGIQVDGSQDRVTRDVKYLLARICIGCELKSVFLGIDEPESKGAQGLLEAVDTTFKNLGCPLEDFSDKITSITTDGEAANTGKHGGLWALLEKKLGKGLIKIWCACHRADLVFEKMENTVPEIKWWKTDLLSIASYFRCAKSRWKELINISKNQDLNSSNNNEGPEEEAEESHTLDFESKTYFAGQLRRFPKHFEVRMSEHLLRLVSSFLGNLEFCKTYFLSHMSGGSKDEKKEATGFHMKLSDNYFVHLTCVMADVLMVFRILQKVFQTELLLITELKESRDKALLKIKNMVTQPLPFGAEAEFLQLKGLPTNPQDKRYPSYIEKRRAVNAFVPFKRNFKAVRFEILQSAENFLEDQLKDNEIITEISIICEAKSAVELMEAVKPFAQKYKQISLQAAYDEACSLEINKNLPLLESLYFFHDKAYRYPQFHKIFQCVMCAAPHSMGVERAVSLYNKAKTDGRSSLSTSSMSNILLVSINGVGTANFDPIPAVAKFLGFKERRNRIPDPKTYKNREFVKKFFL